MGAEMNRHAMNFGAIMGLLFSINFLVTTVNSLLFLQYFLIGIIIYAVYKFAVHCRENVLGGSISYGAALWYVMQLFLYGSLISAMVRYIFYTYIKPDFLQNQLDETMAVFQSISMSEELTNEVYQQTLEIMTPLNMAFQSIWVNVILGLFLGLIIAAIVKKKNIFKSEELL